MRFTKHLEKKEAMQTLLVDFLLFELESHHLTEFHRNQLIKLRNLESTPEIQDDEEERNIATLSHTFLNNQIAYSASLSATYKSYANDLQERIERDDE